MISIFLLLSLSYVNPQQQTNVNSYFMWQSAMQQSGQPTVTPYNNPSTEYEVMQARYAYWQQQIQMQEAVTEQYAVAFENAEHVYNQQKDQQSYDNMMQAHADLMKQYQAYQNLIVRGQTEMKAPMSKPFEPAPGIP